MDHTADLTSSPSPQISASKIIVGKTIHPQTRPAPVTQAPAWRGLIRRFIVATATWLLLTTVLTGLTSAQDSSTPSPDDQQAWTIFEVAAKAQNSNDYKFAAGQWEKLLREHPTAALVGKATYNLGICYEKLGQHEAAAETFAKSIPQLVGLEAELQPLAYFYQAYCEFLVGQRLSKLSDEPSQKEANVRLSTATKIYDELIKKFPNFEDADQARFFQGNAFEILNRPADAIASYAKMLEYPQPNFKFEGLYFLGQLHQEQGQLSDAIELYERFRKELTTDSHPLLAEVNLNQGKALLSLAAREAEAGDVKAAVESYRTAEAIFKPLAEQTGTNRTRETTELTLEAQFHRAYALANLDQQETAAQLYEQVGSQDEFPLAAQALINAGRCYLAVGKTDRAAELFQRSSETAAPVAIEAVSLLSRILLDKEDFDAAFNLNDGWINKDPSSRIVPYLMYDRAEAAFKIPARRADAPALFLELAEKFPEHSSATSALYSAAFAQFQLNQPEAAIATVDRFAKAYPNSDLLPDSLEIKADALMISDENGAETQYDQLIETFAKHPKLNRWCLRAAAAKFFQKKYQATIDLLQPRVDQFDEPRQLAEVFYWLGASHFFLDQTQPAIENLEKSITAGESWRGTDETMLTLARAYMKNDQAQKATQTIQRLQAEFPESLLLDRSHYYLGEFAYGKDDFQNAFESFQVIYTKFPQSDLVPSALYNAAWSKMKLDQAADSNDLFTQLITNFPDHELAAEAQAGRGAAARKTGNVEDSIKDLKAFMETKSDGEEKFNAMFELALAQVDSKSWSEAAQTLQTLLQENPNSSRLDVYHYELAWVLHELNRVPESLEHFAAITKLKPSSRYAAESFFHVASEAYRTEDWKLAEEGYAQAIELGQDDPLREKSLYKLGWTHYKQNQFATAFESFDRQVQQFPSANLSADGYFMRAESLFQQKKYAAALTAYQTAQPQVEASDTIDPRLVLLTHLHGAQAANFAKEYQAAIDLATPLTTGEADKFYQTDAWLEIGTALQGLNRSDDAVAAWTKAKSGSDVTAVRAQCLIGDQYFLEKKFDQAINEFKEIQYRFGEPDAPEEVKAWVAYAYYEAARCFSVQVASAPEGQKAEWIKEAIRQFETLLEKYPSDRLAPEAKSQLEKLKQLRK